MVKRYYHPGREAAARYMNQVIFMTDDTEAE